MLLLLVVASKSPSKAVLADSISVKRGRSSPELRVVDVTFPLIRSDDDAVSDMKAVLRTPLLRVERFEVKSLLELRDTIDNPIIFHSLITLKVKSLRIG